MSNSRALEPLGAYSTRPFQYRRHTLSQRRRDAAGADNEQGQHKRKGEEDCRVRASSGYLEGRLEDRGSWMGEAKGRVDL